MVRDKRQQYLEETKHMTQMRPYSIHRSCFGKRRSRALYLHFHPEMEFLYLESGALSFQIEDEFYEMKEGDAIFLPPKLLHTAFSLSEKGLFRALVFAPEYMSASMEQACFQKYVAPVEEGNLRYVLHLQAQKEWQREIIGLLKRIFAGAETMDNPDMLIGGYLLVIWEYLYQYHISKLASVAGAGGKAAQMEEAAGYIRDCYQEELTLEQLAKAVHLSEGQLCRSFKQQTGITPFTYLKRYRIMQSCVYLAETDKKISEICTLCGFNNISYFNREFLKIMKTTPSQYRRQSIQYAASKRNLLTYSESSSILTS